MHQPDIDGERLAIAESATVIPTSQRTYFIDNWQRCQSIVLLLGCKTEIQNLNEGLKYPVASTLPAKTSKTDLNLQNNPNKILFPRAISINLLYIAPLIF